jgi:hypothetical protein
MWVICRRKLCCKYNRERGGVCKLRKAEFVGDGGVWRVGTVNGSTELVPGRLAVFWYVKAPPRTIKRRKFPISGRFAMLREKLADIPEGEKVGGVA